MSLVSKLDVSNFYYKNLKESCRERKEEWKNRSWVRDEERSLDKERVIFCLI